MPRAMNKGSEASTSKNLNAPESGSEGASQNAIGQVTKVSAATFHFTATFTRHLTLELSGGAAVRLNDWLGICGQSATRRTTRRHAIPTSQKPHALKLDGLPQTSSRLAEAKHYTTTRR